MSQKGLSVQQWEGIGLDPALPVRMTSGTRDEGREERRQGNEDVKSGGDGGTRGGR